MEYKTSIDKIKLLFKLTGDASGLRYFINNICQRKYYCEDVNCDTRPYHYLYSTTIYPKDANGNKTEGAFYIAWSQNGDKFGGNANPLHICIEFNPNKGKQIYLAFWGCVDCQLLEIKQFDLAFDFPCTFDNLVVNNRRSAHWALGGNGSYTHYIRPKEKNGRVKAYDKQLERKLHGIDIPPTTRIEVTCSNLPFNVGKYSKWGNKPTEEFQAKIREIMLALGQVGILQTESNNPLVTLLIKADAIDRETYLNSVSKNTKYKLKKEIDQCVSYLQFDCDYLIKLVLHLTKEFIND